MVQQGYSAAQMTASTAATRSHGMKATLFTAVVALAAGETVAADALTRDEIEKLPFMTALAYAEAIDAYCLPVSRYASTALMVAANAQADLQNKLFVADELETGRLKADR